VNTAIPPSLERRVSHASSFPAVDLSMGVHLLVEDWADARIGQSLEINISLTIAKS